VTAAGKTSAPGTNRRQRQGLVMGTHRQANNEHHRAHRGLSPPGPVLSICIVSWNVREYLLRCLESIHEDRFPRAFEILIVDNDSSDGSAEAVQERFPGIALLKNSSNVGFPRAMNQILSKARGAYVLLLNPDTEVRHGALETLVTFLERHPDAGAVTAKLVTEDGTLQPECRRNFPTVRSEFFELSLLSRMFPRHRWFGVWRMGDWVPSEASEIPAASGACLLVKREVLDAVGPLDERCFMHMEDIDLCYRIREQGWKIYIEPAATVIHHGLKSSEHVKPYIRHLSYNGRYRFFMAHYGPVQATALRVMVFYAMLPRIALYGLKFLVSSPEARKALKDLLLEYWLTLRWSVLLEEARFQNPTIP